MKKYDVKYSDNAEKVIEKLDAPIRKRIKKWIDENLRGCENPRWNGKPLHGNLADKWRYRVGKYRIVAEIHDDEILILIVDVDKRNDIYKN